MKQLGYIEHLAWKKDIMDKDYVLFSSKKLIKFKDTFKDRFELFKLKRRILGVTLKDLKILFKSHEYKVLMK